MANVIAIALICVVVAAIAYYVYKHYFNTTGITCSTSSDCMATQYCGSVSKKCLPFGTCNPPKNTGGPDDCGLSGTCVSGKCTLKKGYCHTVGPIVGGVSDCAASEICVASMSQCGAAPPAGGPATAPSVGAACTVPEDCAANDGWPQVLATKPCNYVCTPGSSGAMGTCAVNSAADPNCCNGLASGKCTDPTTACIPRSGNCIPNSK